MGTTGTDNRAVLVTGAASGIGRATALQYGVEGLRVACFDLAADGVEETRSMIMDAGGEAISFAGDAGDEATVNGTVAATVEAFGGLDVLANVAGVGHFENTHDEETVWWDRIIRVNLTGTFLFCRAALPHVLEARGAIVNVASVAGLKGHAYGSAYSASKGGVIAMTRSMAVEYATRGVRVNAICPGGVNTPIVNSFGYPEGAEDAMFARIIPVTGQMIEPEEIAKAITFLSSDEMRNVTGTILTVDGATTA